MRPALSARQRRARGIGVLLILVGMATIGCLAWQFVGTNIVARHQHTAVAADLRAQWAQTGDGRDAVQDAGPEGEGVALVRIPRFGADYEIPLIRGTSDHDLARGIGWFPESAKPGAEGNFAVAAHRITHGEPFRRFLELRRGDEVVIETRTHVYTYELIEDGDVRVVDKRQNWVIEPDPLATVQGGAGPERVITLVTCAELFHTDDRNVVFGVLQSTDLKNQ